MIPGQEVARRVDEATKARTLAGHLGSVPALINEFDTTSEELLM